MLRETTTIQKSRVSNSRDSDLDGDGDLDVVECNYAEVSMLHFNDGNGGFTADTTTGLSQERLKCIRVELFECAPIPQAHAPARSACSDIARCPPRACTRLPTQLRRRRRP